MAVDSLITFCVTISDHVDRFGAQSLKMNLGLFRFNYKECLRMVFSFCNNNILAIVAFWLMRAIVQGYSFDASCG